MWFLALFSVVVSGVLLGLSVFPGVLEQVPLWVALTAGLTYGLIAFAAAARHLLRRSQPRRWRSVAVVLLSLAMTPILLGAHTPRWLLFRAYQARFEALLAEAPPAGNRAVVQLHANLDLYWVDQWGTDRRGGTYFRTMTSDRYSFGFAYEPNSEGSPFGDEHYRLHHLTGAWYSFAVSDGL